MTAITYTVVDSQDTSWYRDGLTLPEARDLCDERNRENSRDGDRYEIWTGADFREIQSRPDDSYDCWLDGDGVRRLKWV